MIPTAPPLLESRGVRLEPLTSGHIRALTAIGLDPDLWRWTVSRVQTPEDMQAYVEQALREQAEGRSLPFATIDRISGHVAGCTRFGSIDRPNRRVEIGWTWIGRPWQRTHINTEAKLLMLQYAFEEMACIRVELKTDALNERSRNAILRIGAKEEGVLRSHMLTQDGRLRDTVYFSILASEWPGVRARLEARLAASEAA